MVMKNMPLAIKLEESRLDYVKVCNTLACVILGIGNISIDDIMCAYLITCEWCEWAKKPKKEDSPLRKEKLKKCDYTAMFNHMDDVKWRLEIMLTENVSEVRGVFQHLNPHFVMIAVVLKIDFNVQDVEESTKRYYKRLACTADFFEKVHGRNEFSNLLYRN